MCCLCSFMQEDKCIAIEIGMYLHVKELHAVVGAYYTSQLSISDVILPLREPMHVKIYLPISLGEIF